MIIEQDLWGLRTRSEATYLDAVSDDAQSGFIARLCRFPEQKIAWAWVHIFHEGTIHSYTNHEVICDEVQTDETSDVVCYRADSFQFDRTGPRLTPRQVTLQLSARVKTGVDNSHGPGALPMQLEAEFEGGLKAVQSMPGRSEVLGTTKAVVRLDQRHINLKARGHFHEQIQTHPRFNQPFTYGTLRGDDCGLILVRSQRGATGTLILGDNAELITKIRMEAPARTRKFELELTSGKVVDGISRTTYQFLLPIFNMKRHGTLVTLELDGRQLSGCINDLVIDDFKFDQLD